MKIKEVLNKLCAIDAPSGREIVCEENLTSIIMPYFDTFTKLNCNSYLFEKKCGIEKKDGLKIGTKMPWGVIGLDISLNCRSKNRMCYWEFFIRWY